MTDCTSCCSTVCQDALTVAVVGIAIIVAAVVTGIAWIFVIEPALNTRFRRTWTVIVLTLVALVAAIGLATAAWWLFFAAWGVWAMLIWLVVGLSNVAENEEQLAEPDGRPPATATSV